MRKIGLTALWTFVLLNAGLTIYILTKPQSKTGYIYVEKVYEGFKGKREIEKELKGTEARQTGVLDSLKVSITDLAERVKSASVGGKAKMQEQLEIKVKDYQMLVKDYSASNSEESQKRIDGLLKQINQYVKDYGKKNNYSYIYGATGNGSLMYARESDDISDEIIKYINKKYEGE